jgi:hypothetical protein
LSFFGIHVSIKHNQEVTHYLFGKRRIRAQSLTKLSIFSLSVKPA